MLWENAMMLVYINFMCVVMNCDTLSTWKTKSTTEIPGAAAKRNGKFWHSGETRHGNKQQWET
jgi:hypothetical protein